MIKGRTRQAGNREPNGRLQRQPFERIILEFTLKRRAELVGMENALDPRAGHVLGVIWFKRRINDRQFEGGQRMRNLVMRYRTLACIPQGYPGSRNGRGGDVDPEVWREVKEQYFDLHKAITKTTYGGIAWDLLEWLLIDDVMPYRLTQRWFLGWRAVQNGLDAAATYFKITVDKRENPANVRNTA